MTPSRPILPALLAAGSAGILLAAANPPIDAGPVAFVAMVPLLWFLRRARPGRGALLGFVFGLVFYGLLLTWLLPFGVIAWLPAVISQAVFGALFGLVLPRLWRDDRAVRSSLAGAALWAAVDWIRAVVPVTGFTWGALGTTQHGNGFLLPLASVTGVWGLTFVVLLVNALLVGGLVHLRAGSGWGRGAALAGVGAIAVLAPALIPLPAAAGPTLRMAVVQGNVPRELAADRLLQSDVVGESHIALHRELASDPPDLAVWPENSLDHDPAADPDLGRRVSDSIRSVGAPTIVGAITDAPGGRFYNQALLYSPEGGVVDRYTKQHLVPFGEYVPLRPWFDWTDRFRPTPRDLAPGHRIVLFHVRGIAVATPICFENAFPDLFRRFVAAGAQVVVLTTNDSSFLTSPLSDQHVVMSQIRAVETGRWIVQAAVSGHSTVIDPAGRVVAETGLFERTILRARVPTSTSRTLYVRFGDWFPVASAVALLIGVALGWGRGLGTRPSAPPRGERGSHGPPLDPSGHGRAAPAPIAGGAEPRALVILPTYNERATIAAVVGGVLAACPQADVVVVDDASPDGTGDVVAGLAGDDRRVRLIHREGKLGLATAYLTGFKLGLEEGYDVLVEMDADLSHRPEDLPAVVGGADRYDVTIGSRYVPGGAVTNWSRARLALSRAGNAYARAVLGLPVTDATSGFRAFRRGALEALLRQGVRSDGYAFQIELAYRAWRAGLTLGEVPITFREREHGRSKISRRIVLEAVWKVAQWGVRDRVWPRRSSPHPAG